MRKKYGADPKRIAGLRHPRDPIFFEFSRNSESIPGMCVGNCQITELVTTERSKSAVRSTPCTTITVSTVSGAETVRILLPDA